MNGPSPRKALSIRSVAALLLAVVSVVPFYNAVAAETCTTYSNFAGTGSTAKACKDASISGSNWNGRMRSYMSPAVSIDRIGWWWWTNQQWCGGDLYRQFDYGGSVGYNTSNWSSTSPWQKIEYCVLTNQGRVNGKHDFVEGSSTWSPTWYKPISLPTYVDP